MCPNGQISLRWLFFFLIGLLSVKPSFWVDLQMQVWRNTIFNQHLTKDKTIFPRFTQHLMLTSHPFQGAGMQGWEIVNQAPQRLLLKKNWVPASHGRCHSCQGLEASTRQSTFHSSLPNPREPGCSVQGRIFKVSAIPLLAISLQPGGQLIQIDAKMFLLISEFHKHVRSLSLFPHPAPQCF